MDLTAPHRAGPFHVALFLSFWGAFCISGIHPVNRFVWVAQCVAPLLGATLLFAFRHRYLPSRSTAGFLLLQGILLLTGAHYGFHAIPFFRFRMPDGSLRACVDWLTHFVDGVVYARLTAELYLDWRSRARMRDVAAPRHANTRSEGGRMAVWALGASLALACLWELIEEIAHVATNDGFVKDGGFSADTQVDILLTILGSLAAVAAGMTRHAARNRRPRAKGQGESDRENPF